MNIQFYFDPSCPFSWITSRWLIRVATQRELVIDWRPFSLALKNNELGVESTDMYVQAHQQSHRVLRIMLEAATERSLHLGDLYTVFGRQKHIEHTDYSDEVIKQVLAELKVSADILAVADNTKHDQPLQDVIASATKIVGSEVGVPIIVFDNGESEQLGYFGPVLNELPSESDGLKLWDSLVTLSETQEFYELKRTRPKGSPDTGSTRGC